MRACLFYIPAILEVTLELDKMRYMIAFTKSTLGSVFSVCIGENLKQTSFESSWKRASYGHILHHS